MEITFNHRYKVINTIGKQGFSTIYKVLEIKTKKFYALKFIAIVNNDKLKNFKEQYEKEIEVMKTINNKYIIELIDYFIVDNNGYCIVMELCDCNLKEFLNKYKPNGLPINTINKIFTQLNEALILMLENKYCHRNLKPENILQLLTITEQKNLKNNMKKKQKL